MAMTVNPGVKKNGLLDIPAVYQGYTENPGVAKGVAGALEIPMSRTDKIAGSANTGGAKATGPVGGVAVKLVQEGKAKPVATTKSGGGGTTGGGGTGTAATTAKKNPYANPGAATVDPYAGISESTRAAMQGGYAPSAAVTEAQAYLNSLRNNAPGEYNDPYADELTNLYQQIVNRPKFQYDLNGDMLYKQLAQNYQLQGRQAMQDTLGQAAALTGGYGSSYAATAGSQAYQSYLQQLNDRIPDLYNLALNTYNAEGDRLAQNYSMARDMSNTGYNRYQDTVDRYYQDLGLASDAYWNEKNFDYGQYSDSRNYAMQLAQMEQNAAQQSKQYAQNLAMTMLKQGLRPSNAILSAAGLDNYDAWQLYTLAKQAGGGLK